MHKDVVFNNTYFSIMYSSQYRKACYVSTVDTLGHVRNPYQYILATGQGRHARNSYYSQASSSDLYYVVYATCPTAKGSKSAWQKLASVLTTFVLLKRAELHPGTSGSRG